jgi:hypothetical protein
MADRQGIDTMSTGCDAPDRRALLANRFQSLQAFEEVVKVDYYFDEPNAPDPTAVDSEVRLAYCLKGQALTSVLKSGISQKDVFKARDGGLAKRMTLLLRSPYTVANRNELHKIYLLARRMPHIYGEGDVAFFDMAEMTVEHINTSELAFTHPRDNGEKGYLNTFNHVIAQAMISSCFSEKLADAVADLHELHNMVELTHGHFKPEQLVNPNQNPVDNYVDMINNEWGQEIGKRLKRKYAITTQTQWTPILLSDYLNDIQSEMSWAYEIGLRPFRPTEERLIRFATKLNIILQGASLNMERGTI